MNAPGSPTSSSGEARRPRDTGGAQARSEWLRVAIFLATGLLLIATFVFTTVLVNRLSQQIAQTSEMLARLCAQTSFPATRDPELRKILTEIIAQTDFPIVITDNDSLPRAWRNVGLDPAQVSDASVDSLGQGMPISPVIEGRIRRLQARAQTLDQHHTPIAMLQPITGMSLGLLHYGDPAVLGRLRWMPQLSAAGLLLIVAFGWWGLAAIRRDERRSIWVGMALETAHQLGTPLSSLMGWIELLRSRADGSRAEVRIPYPEIAETLDEMERDVERLTKVAHRFSHVGSAPLLEVQDVVGVVRQAVEYMRRRLPDRGDDFSIQERYVDLPPLPCNPELLEWVIENLLLNAASALDKKPGIIEVSVGPRAEGHGAEIIVRDNGRGMNLSEQRRAFEPGYTTKRRGWGLGLALARRVVQEYHRGRVFIRRSAPGEGTTVVVSLSG